MKKKSLVVGCGKLFQLVHLQNIRKNTKIKILIDPRKKLLNKILFEKKGLFRFTNFDTIETLQKKFDIIFNISSRQSSYYVIKKFLKFSKIIFSEKPGVFNYSQAKNLKKISKNYNSKVFFGYMARFDQNIIRKKKILSKQKLNDLINADFYISNNNFYLKNKKHFNSKEKKDFDFAIENYPNFLNKKFHVNYHIFINRYSHIINLIHFFLNNLKVKKFGIIDKYNYQTELSFKNKNIGVKFSNKGNYLIKIKFDYERYFYQLKMFNPLKNKASILTVKDKKTGISKKYVNYTNLFHDEIKSTINNKKNISFSTLEDLIKDFSLIDEIWKKTNH